MSYTCLSLKPLKTIGSALLLIQIVSCSDYIAALIRFRPAFSNNNFNSKPWTMGSRRQPSVHPSLWFETWFIYKTSTTIPPTIKHLPETAQTTLCFHRIRCPMVSKMRIFPLKLTSVSIELTVIVHFTSIYTLIHTTYNTNLVCIPLRYTCLQKPWLFKYTDRIAKNSSRSRMNIQRLLSWE